MQRRSSHSLSCYYIDLGLALLLTSMVGCNSAKEELTNTESSKPPLDTTLTTTALVPVMTNTKAVAVTDFIKSAVTEASSVDSPSSEFHDVLITGKKLSTINTSASESPRDDGIHDTINDAIVMLQNPAMAMKDFPRDRRQQVDWVQALEQGLIEPRADLLGKGAMVELDLDIMMKNTQFMPWVKFPHDKHTKWLACSNCHPAIFKAKEHANSISMDKVLRGEYCGVCHDKVAFALFTCERCHNVPHEGSGPKWW